MTGSCQSALLEIQYFIVRDFRLDARLYGQCLADAVQFCHAPANWSEDAIGPQRNPLVLPCLYRFAYHPKPTAMVCVPTRNYSHLQFIKVHLCCCCCS